MRIQVGYTRIISILPVTRDTTPIRSNPGAAATTAMEMVAELGLLLDGRLARYNFDETRFGHLQDKYNFTETHFKINIAR